MTDFEGTVTYIQNVQRNINQNLADAIDAMTEEQLRNFLFSFLDDKRTFENKQLEFLFESKDKELAEKTAVLLDGYAQSINNNIKQSMEPQRDSSSLGAMFK